MSSTKIGNDILQFLYDKFQYDKKHVDGEEILHSINVSEFELKNALQILEDNELVNVIRPSAYLPKIKITSEGRKYIIEKNEHVDAGPQLWRILLTGSDPKNDLDIRDEFEFIQDELLLKSPHKQKFQTAIYGSITKSDFVSIITEFKPHIIHFSGHGMNDGSLLINDERTEINTVEPTELAELLSIVKNKIKIHGVILNACYSEKQANEIVKHVDNVIGISGQIKDDDAKEFAVKFYEGLGNGYSIKQSFSLAKLAMGNKLLNYESMFVIQPDIE